MCGVPTCLNIRPDTLKWNVRCPPPLLLKYLRILCGVPNLVLTSDQMFQIGLVSPHLILKHLISSVVILAQLVSLSLSLQAELVIIVFLVLATA